MASTAIISTYSLLVVVVLVLKIINIWEPTNRCPLVLIIESLTEYILTIFFLVNVSIYDDHMTATEGRKSVGRYSPWTHGTCKNELV